MTLRYHLVLALTLLSSSVSGASVDEAMRDLVATYDFDPSQMTFDQQAERAPTLSQLWSRFNKSPDSYRDALRELLRQQGGREMLYCDGGMLFLQKARQAADKSLGLTSISKCSLAEIQHTPYFYTMHAQALAGSDTLDLQFKMLTKPKYQIFIPMHSLTLGQNYSFVYPLLVQDELNYTGRLIERTNVETNPVSLNTLLLALYYSAVSEAEAAIHTVVTSKIHPAEARERAKLIEQRIVEARKTDPAKVHDWLRRNGMANASELTEKELRDARRKRMRAISDEALMELDAYTVLIYQARK